MDFDDRVTIVSKHINTYNLQNVMAVNRFVIEMLKDEPRVESLYNDEVWKKLKKNYLLAMKKITEETELTSSSDYASILSVWAHFDEKSFRSYIEETIKDPKKLLKFVCSATFLVYDSDDEIFCNPIWEAQYLDPETVRKVIDEYDKRDLLKGFSKDELEKLVVYYECIILDKMAVTSSWIDSWLQGWKLEAKKLSSEQKTISK